MIEFPSSGCGHVLRLRDEYAGKKGKCPKCHQVIVVPTDSHVQDPGIQAPPTRTSVAPQPPAQVPPFPVPPAVSNAANVHPKETSGLGIAALVLGIVACLTCWIPLVGLLTIPLSGIGLLLAIIGFLLARSDRRSSTNMPIAGGIVCVVAIGLAIMSTTLTATALNQVIEKSKRSLPSMRPRTVPPAPPRRTSTPSTTKDAPRTLAKDTKIYTSVDAILENVPSPTMPEVKEWNALTTSKVRDWFAATNQTASSTLSGNRISLRATISNYSVVFNSLHVSLRAPHSASAFKGCPIGDKSVYMTLVLDRKSAAADQLAQIKLGEKCTVTGTMRKMEIRQNFDLRSITNISIELENDAELSDFESNPALRIKIQ